MQEFKRIIKFFWGYLSAYKLQLAVIMLAITVSTYFQVKAPQYIGKAIEELANYGISHFTTGVADKTAFHNTLRVLLIFYVLMAVVTFIQNILMAGVSERATNKMRVGLFRKMEKLSRFNSLTVAVMGKC